jgi:hypothetical protein
MTPAETVAEHLKQCAHARAAIVVDGNADAIIARMLAAGWTWSERHTELIGGKRIRYLSPPAPPALEAK